LRGTHGGVDIINICFGQHANDFTSCGRMQFKRRTTKARDSITTNQHQEFMRMLE
jgi:hypothetical protein